MSDAIAEDRCVHHWRLEASRRDGTPGECRRCGARRTFLGGSPADEYQQQIPWAGRGSYAYIGSPLADAIREAGEA